MRSAMRARATAGRNGGGGTSTSAPLNRALTRALTRNINTQCMRASRTLAHANHTALARPGARTRMHDDALFPKGADDDDDDAADVFAVVSVCVCVPAQLLLLLLWRTPRRCPANAIAHTRR